MKTLKQIEEMYAMYEAGEIDETTLNDTLESIELETAEEIAAVALAVLRAEQMQEAVKSEEKRLQAKRRGSEEKTEKMREIMIKCMHMIGMEKIKSNLINVSIRKNPASLVVEDEERVPEEYCTYVRKVENAKIKALLAAGEELSFAKLVRGESLSFK